MMRTVFILIVLLFSSIFAFSGITLNGSIRNDSFFSRVTNQWQFDDILENKLIFSEKSESWRFYADTRLDMLFGGASEFHTNIGTLSTNISVPYVLNLMRLFIRYDSPGGIVTIGKTYVPFGNPGVFNPLDMDKQINTSDLSYDKPGILAAVYEFSSGDLSGGKVFISPQAGVTNSGFGAGLYFNLFNFDFGAAAFRKDISRNTAGIYFKGDLGTGLNASYAYHFDDYLTNRFSEASAGIDYSFLEGKLIPSLTFYYNESGAVNTNDYRFDSADDTYFKSRYYFYANLTYIYDEFLGFQINTFVNAVDRSGLLMPQITYTLTDGLDLTGLIVWIWGSGAQEFSKDRSGSPEYGVLCRLEGKL